MLPCWQIMWIGLAPCFVLGGLLSFMRLYYLQHVVLSHFKWVLLLLCPAWPPHQQRAATRTPTPLQAIKAISKTSLECDVAMWGARCQSQGLITCSH